jgi:hypothetical protein
VKTSKKTVAAVPAAGGRKLSVGLDVELQITSFVHCGKCLDSLPDGVSPREWAQHEVGFTGDGRLQVWCKRHDVNVMCEVVQL